MGNGYKQYAGKSIPKDIFGLDEININPGDGWGYIHKDLIPEECVSRFFSKPISTKRVVPDDVYVFRADFLEVLGEEKNKSLQKKMLKLYHDYRNGWRFDGKNEDLGPVNGPLPIQELIKANYIYLTTMFVGR